MTVIDDRERRPEHAEASYRTLPTLADTGYRHAWREYAEDDRLGSLNRLDGPRLVRAARLVSTGTAFPLDLTVGEIDPPLFGRSAPRHTIEQTARNFFEDRLDNYYLQSSSQWDGFGHIRFREHGFWQGRRAEPSVGGDLGIDAWGEHGIAGRGVLIDVAAYRAAVGHPIAQGTNETITTDDLHAATEHFGIEIESGDILCIRTGWIEWYRGLSAPARSAVADAVVSPGLVGSDEMAELLWDWKIAALAVDNPAIEPVPGNAELHRRLIPLLGFAVGELFCFEALAAACREDGRYEFMFTSSPIRLPGGLGSPANALAIR